MTIKYILAMKSEDGEILLGDQTDDFMASFKDGRWIADDIFEFYDLEENFWHIQDDAEIHRLMAEARAALESQSHPGLSPKP